VTGGPCGDRWLGCQEGKKIDSIDTKPKEKACLRKNTATDCSLRAGTKEGTIKRLRGKNLKGLQKGEKKN